MVPQKVQQYFVITREKKDGDNNLVEGKLTCCNAHDFKVLVGGTINCGIFSKLHLSLENDKILMKVQCQKCGKVITVFDNSSDGYSRCAPSSPMPIKPLRCKKCLGDIFSVDIRYEYPDIQELKELEIEEIDNAFTWIWSTLECNKCRTRYKNFLDYETT